MILRRFLAGLIAAPRETPPRVEQLPGHNVLVRGRHGRFVANPHDVYIGQSLIRYGEFSEAESALLRRLCPPGGTVVEVGANIGAHTVALAGAVGPSGRVIAIEPQPEVHRMLCENIALNSLDQVAALSCGCGAAPGTAYIPDYDYAYRGNFGNVVLQGSPQQNATVAVEVQTLDALVPEGPLALLKIDVEGMEAEVIQGGASLIGARRPALYVENDIVARSPALIRLIGGLGYRMWWHMPPLFNPANYFGEAENLFPNTVSFNMLCLHGAGTPDSALVGQLPEVTDPDWHPKGAG